MTSAWMVVLVLVGPPQVTENSLPPETVASPGPPQALPKVRSRDALRGAYRRAMQKSASRADPEPEDVVPGLVSLYGEVANAADMAPAERRRLRRGVRLRLVQMRDKLIRESLRREREARRVKHGSSGRHDARNGQNLAGGGANDRAAELIELIQTTIAPDTWDVNGGNGSIYYYRPLHALVVRQTGEVHHQIGGLLQALRR
jgi:hypothetical protein